MRIPAFMHDTKGAASVEFALVSIVFVTCLLGIAQVALYVANQQDLMWAVHATGRYAVVHEASSGTPAAAADLVSMVGSKLALIDPSVVTTTVTFSPDSGAGSTVRITASFTWKPIMPFLKLPDASITATSAATILN